MPATTIKKNRSLSKKHAMRVATQLRNARTLHLSGNLQEAETIYISILNRVPDHPDALYLLGVIAHQVGQPDLAITRFEQTLACKPDYADAHNNMADAFNELGKLTEAIFHYKKAVSIKPEFPEPHINLGNCYTALMQFEEAIFHFEQALRIKPDSAETHYNLGITLQKSGNTEQSVKHYQKSLQLKPDFVEAHNNLGALLQDLGKKEAAIEHYELALASKPDFAWMHFNLTNIKPRQEQLPIIEQLLASPKVSNEDAIYYHHALGNIYNNAKDYNKSFEHFAKGNKLKRKTFHYDAKQHSAFVDRLIETYSETYFIEKKGSDSDSELPVFILGMPRSGTTLVEQIVSSHPQVFGADELSSLGRIEAAIAKQFETTAPYPQCMSHFGKENAQKFSARYLKELNRYSQDALRITDKMPFNFLKIGLIKQLFPKARIIHCKRNALDTCTSIFLNYFISGNEFSYDLTEIGQFYLDYERLMKHWHSLFPAEIFNVQYESLIDNQDEVTHQLIEYLDLDWDEDCLDFHHNDRAVKTASNLQVRQPLYTKSVKKWKRYEAHLQPLMTTLQSPSAHRNQVKRETK